MTKRDLKPVFEAFKKQSRTKNPYRTENILYGVDVAKGTVPYALGGVAVKYALLGIGEGYDRVLELVDKAKESVRIDKKVGNWFDKITGKEETQTVATEPKVDYSEKLDGYGNIALLTALIVGLGVSALRGYGQHYDRKMRKRQTIATERLADAMKGFNRNLETTVDEE